MADKPAQIEDDNDLEDVDTAEEFQAHYIDAQDAQARFQELAAAADKAGKSEIASVYREMGGTVVSLVRDIVMSTGGALESLEEAVDELLNREGAPTESVLLASDAKEYLSYFEQVLRLLDGLTEVLPHGAAGDDQRKVFGLLRNMTNDRIEFTKAIAAEEDPDAEPETVAGEVVEGDDEDEE